MVLHPKTRLGSYEILGRLGAGGMGEVYLARDTRLGRDIAVKVLPGPVASSADRLSRFEREARTVAGLNHPNIVVLHSIEEEDGVRFLTMELVDGQTLATLVTPGGLPLSRVLELSIPLADALVAAHERGVVHRDLKPGNVMVTREGRVKVLDFGLAKLASGADPALEMTQTAGEPLSGKGQVLGTVPYMAPEQIRGEAVDTRTDLFALGIILYELAAGRRPFTGRTQADVGSSILRDTPESLTNVRADLPEDFDRIVSRCLEKNPRQRSQTALDVLNELRRLRHTLEHGAPAKPPSQLVASIAVLPFVIRSRDEEDECFSAGLADELLNVLAKIRGLRVAARTSSFQFRGTTDDLATIGRKLNVATLLEGSVRTAGNRVRISVQLVKVSDGYHLWSETYDRALDDIFAVQDDIAQSVVKELRTTLLGEVADSRTSGEAKADVARAARGRGHSVEAHRLFLQGRFFLDRANPDLARAVGYFKEALDLDPDFALAWAELGRAHIGQSTHGLVAEGYELGREAVERGLSLEPDLPEGHAALAWIKLVHEWNWTGAEYSLRRAMELAPGNAAVLRRAAVLAWTQNRLEEAIGFNRRAIEQDPLNCLAYVNLGTAYHAAGRLTEAEEAYRKAIEFAPERGFTRSMLALVLWDEGKKDEALSLATCEPSENHRLQGLAIIHHAAGREGASDEALRELVEKYADAMPFEIAEIHALRDQADEAFSWLERAYAKRSTMICDLNVSTRLSSLRGDPRWGAFLKKMNFQ